MSAPTKISAVLLGAARLVSAGWTKGAYARSRSGHETRLLGPRVCRVCLSGAIQRASAAGARSPRRRAARALDNWYAAEKYVAREVAWFTGDADVGIVTFNDRAETTKADVLEVLRRAREAALAEGR